MPRAVLSSEPANVIGLASSPSATEPLQLHIGCGNQRLPGYINCDLHRTPATDRVFDCTGRWPFANESASTIYCSHTLEHLHDYQGFFKEAYRVLRPDGNLQIRVPYGGHKAAYWDLTHVRPWYAETFCFLQPGYSTTVGNAQHDQWQHFFSIDDAILRLSGRLIPLLRWTLIRKLLLPWVDMLQDSIEELWIYLTPLKTDQQVTEWLSHRQGNALGARYSIYRHHLEGRPLGPHERAEFLDWRKDMLWNGFHMWKECK